MVIHLENQGFPQILYQNVRVPVLGGVDVARNVPKHQYESFLKYSGYSEVLRIVLDMVEVNIHLKRKGCDDLGKPVLGGLEFQESVYERVENLIDRYQRQVARSH